MLVFFLVLIALLLLLAFLVYRPKTSVSGSNTKENLLGTSSSFAHPVNTILFSSLPADVQKAVVENSGTPPHYPNTNIPASFDARQKWPGLITGPLDQEKCGSCWAFSTTTSMSDRWRITYPNDTGLRRMITQYYPAYPDTTEVYSVLNNISPYQLVSCDLCNYLSNFYPEYSEYFKGAGASCNEACGGGTIEFAFDYLIRGGANSILDTDPIPCNPASPQGENGCPCKYNRNATVYKAKSRYMVTNPNDSNETKRQKIMLDVLNFGPVSVGYTVYQSFYDFFDQNPNGIYTASDAPPNDKMIGGHAVVIVGWGTDPTTGIFYWIIRNSWGLNWGNQGFFKIQYDLDGILEEPWGIVV